MSDRLRAVVIGAGLAGEGHTLALRHNGVDVVAICARQADVVRTVADQLGIPEASIDWRRTLERVRPDIVSLATPASLRGEAIQAAVEGGCHIFCDKPLATNGDEAKRLYHLVQSAGVKHAYAATHRYDPSVAYLAELVQDGAIGALREIDGTFRFPLSSPLTPWSWFDALATGGGLLNNGLPHLLGILKTVTGGEPLRVMGEARTFRRLAPVVPDLHDFRNRSARMPTQEEAERLEWRACDADDAFSALFRFGSGAPGVSEVHVALAANAVVSAPRPPNGWRLYGEEGMLLADGIVSYALFRQLSSDAEREPLPVPERLIGELPRVGSDGHNKYGALARDFVADIHGERHRPYLTFRDGWRFQEAFDAIRAGHGWQDLPM
jgi:predicted dehydrogenase